MLRVLTTSRSIAGAQRELRLRLEAEAEKSGRAVVGFPGGQRQVTVRYCNELDLWMSFERLDNRIWNSFGFGDPFQRRINPIVVEVNSPYEGVDRRIGGAFATDGRTTYLVHRGKIGGGRAGISKSAFLSAYKGPLRPVQDGDNISELLVIGAVQAEQFPAHIHAFVRLVDEFKQRRDRSNRRETSARTRSTFTPEFRGKKKYSTKDEIIAECNHALVVDALRTELANRGLRAANDRQRDLFVNRQGGRAGLLFEIKTAGQPYYLYTAIGQLLFNRAGANEVLVAVLPAPMSQAAKSSLARLGIRVVTYEWNGQTPRFAGLKRALAIPVKRNIT